MILFYCHPCEIAVLLVISWFESVLYKHAKIWQISILRTIVHLVQTKTLVWSVGVAICTEGLRTVDRPRADVTSTRRLRNGGGGVTEGPSGLSERQAGTRDSWLCADNERANERSRRHQLPISATTTMYDRSQFGRRDDNVSRGPHLSRCPGYWAAALSRAGQL